MADFLPGEGVAGLIRHVARAGHLSFDQGDRDMSLVHMIGLKCNYPGCTELVFGQTRYHGSTPDVAALKSAASGDGWTEDSTVVKGELITLHYCPGHRPASRAQAS